MFLWLCVLLATAAHAAEERRLALVIGNDSYQHVSKLEKAGNDASAMARELKAAGFEVELRRDVNFRAMVKSIESFTSRISGGDQVIVFYAGHGVQIKSGNYLLPVDIEVGSESEIEKTAYSLDDLTAKLAEAKASFSLVMIDACRDNPLKAAGRSAGGARGLSSVEPPKGQMVVFSASRGQQALDKLSDIDKNPNGVFTREFIARMKTPNIRVQDLMVEVQDAVEGLARSIDHDQRPALYNESRGSFYFYGSGSPKITLTAPAGSDPESETWLAASSSNTAMAYQAYLKAYPGGRYSAAANIKLESFKLGSTSQAVINAQPKVNEDAENGFWNEVKSSGSKEYLEAYLRQYSKGKYAALARLELKKLEEQDKARKPKEENEQKQTLEEQRRTQEQAEQRNNAVLEQMALKKAVQTIKDCADCPELVVLPAGSFTMGSSAQEQAQAQAKGASKEGTDRESPQRRVRVASFALGKTEVTRGQYAAFVQGSGYAGGGGCWVLEEDKWKQAEGADWRKPGYRQSERDPVACVNWDDAQAYVKWLSKKTGQSYQLPSEAQWEYACRVGGGQRYCGSDVADEVAVHGRKGGDKTQPVGTKKPNVWGLYDMSGNVVEWTQDCWNESYAGAPTDGAARLGGNCGRRVMRGGSWYGIAIDARSALRSGYVTTSRNSDGGFRLARMLP